MQDPSASGRWGHRLGPQAEETRPGAELLLSEVACPGPAAATLLLAALLYRPLLKTPVSK